MKIRRTDIERILILCAAALVVVLALKGGSQKTTEILYNDASIDLSQTASDATGPSNGETVPTLVYYQDGDGYLVPVTRQVPKQDGIAKATLSLMVKSAQNDMDAARMGLRTVIPEGTTFDIDIANGKARVDMSKEALSCQSLEEETLMVQAVAGTLGNFETVETVDFLFDGQKRSKLTFGTDVSGAFSGDLINLESVSTSAGQNASQIQLYFPSQTGRVMVPVTRTVFSNADMTTAMLELAKGPREDSGLERALPKEVGVKSVSMKNGTVTVDFTKEFGEAVKDSGAAKHTLRAITYTLSRFPDVKKVEVTVEGVKYTPEKDDTATFVNDADEVMSQYPGVVEID